MAQISIEHLSFVYPGTQRKVLDDVNLSIRAGEYITICGKSGCGKTTLLRHLKSELTPVGERSGRVLFFDRPIDEVGLREQSERIGFVMQNPDAQIVTDRVWHELAFGLESLGYDQKAIRLRVAEMASYFGIQSWFHRDVGELSGGQKQLLNLAGIMAMQPSVLVLDEPTSQLDPIAAADFLNTIRKINLELGTTIILTEHRLEEVFPCADRVIVMENGRIVADADPHTVGDYLNAEDNDMYDALPAPMRIFYGFNARLAKGETEPTESELTCPLTVREGRTWLSLEAMAGHIRLGEEDLRSLPYEEDAEPVDPKDASIFMKDVWLRYRKDGADVLRGTSLTVPAGTFCAILGGNGSGKSTTLRALCGTKKPYRGKVLIRGKRIEDYKGKELFRGCVSMLPQDPENVFAKNTVREELKEMVEHDNPQLAAEKVTSIVELMDIGDILDSHPFDLSGGEQQRAALAKVLLTDPKILLLDEPTKGIDSAFKNKLARVFDELCARGVTIVMASHDVEFCAKNADLVAMFFDGDVVTIAPPRRFFARNSFYTTAANRMSRHLFENAVTDEDVIELCLS